MKTLIKGALERVADHFGPHRRSIGEPRLWVLMYHRILPRTDARFAREEPGMIVTPDTFRQQLRTLKTLFDILPLTEWVTRQESGKPLPQRACAITFDDGWLDNYEFAFPILQQEQVPATLFAVADMIGTQRQFWPNRLARVLAATTKDTQTPWLREFGFQAGKPADREITARIILNCKQLDDSELHDRLNNAERSLGLSAETSPALMSWDQLRQMQDSELVDVGSHTCNHFRLLPSLPAALLRDEITASRHKLERHLGRAVTSFCYPNGDYTSEAARLVREHYRAAVTTQRGINTAHTPRHTLLRIGIHEDVGQTPTKFGARLSGWL